MINFSLVLSSYQNRFQKDIKNISTREWVPIFCVLSLTFIFSQILFPPNLISGAASPQLWHKFKNYKTCNGKQILYFWSFGFKKVVTVFYTKPRLDMLIFFLLPACSLSKCWYRDVSQLLGGNIWVVWGVVISILVIFLLVKTQHHSLAGTLHTSLGGTVLLVQFLPKKHKKKTKR